MDLSKLQLADRVLKWFYHHDGNEGVWLKVKDVANLIGISDRDLVKSTEVINAKFKLLLKVESDNVLYRPKGHALYVFLESGGFEKEKYTSAEKEARDIELHNETLKNNRVTRRVAVLALIFSIVVPILVELVKKAVGVN